MEYFSEHNQLYKEKQENRYTHLSRQAHNLDM